MTTYKQALNLVLGSVQPLGMARCPLEKCLGYALAETIIAPADLPEVARSVMDGYALRSRDTIPASTKSPVQLHIVGDVYPSSEMLPPVRENEAVRIMTGGAIPPGADAVVKNEEIVSDETMITLHNIVPPRSYISEKGKEVKAGDPIAQQGTIIDPVLLSLFASLRITTVPVISNPRVGILAVGNELVALHDHQGNGKIVASNLFMLSAFVESMGAQVAFAHVTNNNEEAILKDLEKGKQCDLIITTGGTAHGLSDRTRMVLKKAGTRFLFTGIRAVPGKGTSFGFYGKTPIFSLPGTPPSVFTIFHTLIHPCLMTLMGYPGRFPIVVSAILENRVHKKPGMTHFVNAHVHQKEGRYGVHPLTGPRGGLFYSMAQANGFMVVPEDRTRLEKGEAVAVHLLRSPSPCAFSAGLAGTHGKQDTPPPCVSIVGKSNAGKTTLLEKLIPELTRRGYKVGTIKHDVHGFDIDHEGKDTWRHKKAGAATVTISSPAKVAVIQDVTMEKPLHRLVERYYGNRDIVLTEGYKKEKMPKIEIFRKSAHKEPLCTNDEDLVAMVSDTTIDVGVPRFSLDDIKGLADLLEKKFLQPPPNPPAY